MHWLIMAGAAPSYVIILFGLIAIAAAAGFAVRPDTCKLPDIGALYAAALFSSLCGVATVLVAVSHDIDTNGNQLGDSVGRLLVVGVGESLAPAILGFAMLSIVALVGGIGLRRLAR